MTEQSLTRYFHSGGATSAIFVLAVAAVVVARNLGAIPYFSDTDASLFPLLDLDFGRGVLSLTANFIIVAFACRVLIFITRSYNPFRFSSTAGATLFITFLIGDPSVLAGFYGGSVLLAGILMCLLVLLSVYQQPGQTRRVFLVFFLLSAGSMIEYIFLFYIPVLLLGVAQMRVMSAKSFVAVILGIITPYWIAFGFGLLDPGSVQLPEMVSVFSGFSSEELLPFSVAAGFTIVISVVMLLLTFMKVVGYNARIRGANGLMMTVLIATILLSMADYRNFPLYLPLLAWAGAYQGAHYLMMTNGRRTYIPVLSAIVLYFYFFLWNTLV